MPLVPPRSALQPPADQKAACRNDGAGFEQAENPLFYIERQLRRNFLSVSVEGLICNITDENRVQEILEKYKPYKIWALLYPIAWVNDSHPVEWFWYELPNRAKTYNHYIIGANWSVDEKQDWFGYGFSEIISPEGKILANSNRLYGSDIIYANIKTAPIPK